MLGKTQRGGAARSSQVAPADARGGSSSGKQTAGTSAASVSEGSDVRRITAASSQGKHVDINVLDQLKLGGGGAGLGLEEAEHEASVLDQMLQTSKQGIMELFHLLLRHSEMNPWLQLGVMGLEALQVLSFTLSFSSSLPWRDTPAIRPVSATLNVFNLGITDGTFPQSGRLGVLYAVLVILIIVGMACVWLVQQAFALGAENRARLENGAVLKVLRSTLQVLAMGAFMPIVGVFFDPLRCETGTTWLGGPHDCWQPVHLVAVVGTLLCQVAFLGFISLYTVAVVDRNPRAPQNRFAAAHGRSRLMVLGIRTALVLVFVLDRVVPYFMLLAVLGAAGLAELYVITTYQPFYSHTTNQFYAGLAILEVWGALLGLIGIMQRGGEPNFDPGADRRHENDIAFIFYLAGPFVAWVAGAYLSYRFRALDGEVELNSVYVVELKARRILRKAGTGSNAGKRLGVSGYEGGRQASAGSQSAASGFTGKQSSKDDQARSSRLAIDEAETLLADALEFFPENNMLHVFVQIFLASYKPNKHLEASHLAALRSKDPDFDELFLAFHRRQILAEEAAKTMGGSMNIQNRVRFEEFQRTAEDYEVEARQKTIDFLNHLVASSPDIGALNIFSREVFDAQSKAELAFAQLLSINPRSVVVLRQYAQFLLETANQPVKAQKLLDEADALEDEASRMHQDHASKIDFMSTDIEIDVAAEGMGVILCSDDPASLGEILQANPAAIRAYGYTRKELVGKNVSMLTPEPIQSLHDGIIQNYLRTGKETIMNTSRTLFSMHRAGHIFPVVVAVRSMEGGFGGLIQEIRGAVDGFVLVLTRSGIITGACSKTMQMLGLHGDDVSSLTVRLGDFIPSWRQDLVMMGSDAKSKSYFKAIVHARARQKKRMERRRRMQGGSQKQNAAAEAAAAAAGAKAAAEVAAETAVVKGTGAAGAAGAAAIDGKGELPLVSSDPEEELSEADKAQNQIDLDYEAVAKLRRLGIADRHFVLFQRISRSFVGQGLRTVRGKRVVGAWSTARVSYISGAHLPGGHPKDHLCLIKWRPGPFPKNHDSLLGSSDEERAAAEDDGEEDAGGNGTAGTSTAASASSKNLPALEGGNSVPEKSSTANPGASSLIAGSDPTTDPSHSMVGESSEGLSAEAAAAAVEVSSLDGGRSEGSGGAVEVKPALAASLQPSTSVTSELGNAGPIGEISRAKSLRGLGGASSEGPHGEDKETAGSMSQHSQSVGLEDDGMEDFGVVESRSHDKSAGGSSNTSSGSAAAILRKTIERNSDVLEDSLQFLYYTLLGILVMICCLNIVSLAVTRSLLGRLKKDMTKVTEAGRRQVLGAEIQLKTQALLHMSEGVHLVGRRRLEIVDALSSPAVYEGYWVDPDLPPGVTPLRQLAATSDNVIDRDFNSTINSLTVRVTEMDLTSRGLYLDSNSPSIPRENEVYVEQWFDVLRYEVGELVAYPSNLMDACWEYVYRARLAARTPEDLWSLDDRNVRFILENSLYNFTDALNASTQIIKQTTEFVFRNAYSTAAAVLFSAMGGVFVMLVFVLLPIARYVETIRDEVWHLFLDVPLVVMRNMRAQYQKRLDVILIQREDAENVEADVGDVHSVVEDGDGGLDWASFNLNQTNSSARTFRKSWNLFMFQLFKLSWPLLLAMLYFALSYVWVTNTIEFSIAASHSIVFSAQREVLASQIDFFTVECVAAQTDEALFRFRDLAVQSAEDLEYVDKLLLYGDASRGVHSALDVSEKQNRLFLEDGCMGSTGELQERCSTFFDGVLRQGLLPASQEFTALSRAVVNDIASAIAANQTLTRQERLQDSRLSYIRELGSIHLGTGYKLATFITHMEVVDYIDSFLQTHMLTTILVILLLAIGFIFLYRPLVFELDNDTKQARLMLLIFPERVIRGIDSIRQLIAKLSGRRIRAAKQTRAGMRIGNGDAASVASSDDEGKLGPGKGGGRKTLKEHPLSRKQGPADADELDTAEAKSDVKSQPSGRGGRKAAPDSDDSDDNGRGGSSRRRSKPLRSAPSSGTRGGKRRAR